MSTPTTDEEPVYEVRQIDDGFEVRSRLGSFALQCPDEGNARNYAVLMNEAFAAGYRRGYRDARRGT